MHAGLKLKQIREELGLRYREVEEASVMIAQRNHNPEFIISLSRLSDIENKGTLPTLYRLYTLCAIYRLDVAEVLHWYGVDLDRLSQDAALINPSRTHPIGFRTNGYGTVTLPLKLDPGIDLRRTTYLSRMIQEWGKMPLALLETLKVKEHRYAYIGTDDYMMYPMLQPGSLVQIDESRREIQTFGWNNEYERPVYFFEKRDGYACSWCSLSGDRLILQPHTTSPCAPEMLLYPQEIEVIGQVVAVAMRLEGAKKLKARSAAALK
ncbi:MAG TPA: helix-turn-helix transcriptional regulator [Bryobacterales bacterium]|jgi:transcriptional regulator with XRE-family HTH domain|nr:helix-turn-helix transcriptional regulator [Bryobacterales bacterium]